MKLAVTNIGYNSISDLVDSKIKFLEVAPSAIKPWKELKVSDVMDYREELMSNGIIPVSMLSLFYGTDISTINEIEAIKKQFDVVDFIASLLEVKTLVFGSPNLRKKMDGWEESLKTIFAFVDSNLRNRVVIEPISSYYGTEYFTTIDEVVTFIKENKLKQTYTMIDTHAVRLENQCPIEKLYKYKKYVKHIHVNEVGMGKLKDLEFHKAFKEALQFTSYDGTITYEFTDKDNFKDSVKTFQEIYQ